MTEKYISYKVGQDTYDVPESMMLAFEKKFPSATIEMHVGEDIYDVPFKDRDAFLKKFSNATFTYDKAGALRSGSVEKTQSVNDAPVTDEAPVVEETPVAEESNTAPKVSFWDSLAANPAQSALAIQNAKNPKKKAEVNTDMADATIASHAQTQEKIDEYISNFEQAYAEKASEAPRQKISFWESIASNPSQSALRIQRNEMGQDYADAKIAKRITDKTQDKVDQYNDPSETFVGGAWEGIKDSAFDIDTWDSTVGLEQAQRVHAISQKLDNGETLSEGEQLIIDALVDDLASDMYLAAGFGRGYKAGMVTGESLPFMVETMLNPASGWGKAVAKKFGGSVLKRVATRVAVDIAGAAVMSATTSSARVSADALNRLSGQVDFTLDDNGQFHFTGFVGGEDSAFKAYAKAFGANTIEHFSEMVGDYFSPIGKAVGGWSKGAAVWSADKIGLKKLSTMIKEMTPNGFGAAFGEFLEKTQWHGVIGEFSEEMISGAMNALIVGDQSLRKYDKDGNLNENYLFDKDNMIDTFLGVALLGGFMSSVKTLGYSNPETEHNRKINLAKKGLEGVLTDEQKQMLYDFADNPFGADYADVRELMDGKSVEEKTAIANYLKAVMGKQGFLLGRNADLSGTKQGMEEMHKAFQFGHGLSEADLYDVNDAEAKAAQKLADTGHADVSGLSSYEIYRLSTDANLSAEQQIVLHDLAVIKNAKEGLQSKLNSVAKAAVGITSGIANSAAKDGSIKVSTLNGRTVYVKGDVQIQFGSIVKPDGVSAYPVEVVDQITGEVTTVDSGDLDVIDVYAADAYVSQMSDAIMNSYQQSWENWKTTKSVRSKLADIQQMVGQKVYINAPNGMAQVEIQQILPNGEVVIKGKKSDLGQTTIRVDVDALYDSMSRDSSGNVIFDPSVFRSQSEQTGAPEAPAAPTTPEAPAVPTAPEAPVSPEGTGVQEGDEEYSDDPIDLTPIEDDFDNIEELDETEETEEPVGEDIDFRDQEVEILIDGKPTTVEVTYQDETSNTITYTYVDANGRSRVGSSTIDAFKSAWQQAQNYTEPVEEPVAEPVEAPDSGENAPLEPETINWEELFTRDPENFLAELKRQYGDNADRYIKAMIASAEKQIAKLEKSAPEDANEIFANEQAMDALRARIATLNGMLSRLNATEEVSTEEENAGESHENPVTLGEEQTGESNEGDEVHGTEGHSDETGSTQADDERGEETGETSETLRDGDFDNSEVDKKYPPRKGDITVQALGDTFGFASVELTESEDQQAINSIYDIFMEMAKMLGISPKSIAHGGTLSLAHVPSSVKKETLGRYDWRDIKLELRNSELSSILHEWWHALDHALHSSNLTGTITDFTSAVSKTRFSGRPEVKEAVNKILAAVKKSGHIDRINRSWFPRSYKRYTKEKVEQTARAFEEYIIGKFAEKGIAIEGLKRSSNEAQPTAEEMAIIAPEFDNLFSILMEREGSVAGTSILFQIEKMMEQGDKVKAELGELVADWIRQGGNFVTMDTDAMAAALEEAGVNANVLETADGVVYGFVKDGKVYLNPELINPNTSIHEYTHLWDLALMQLNPALWEKGKKLMKQTPLWDEVINDPNYADIKDNEDLVASEVHSRLVGENGAEVLSQLEQQAREEGLTKSAKKLSILGRLREWLDEATKWLKNAFTAWDKTELDALTLDDFLNMPLSDLANFTKLPTEGVVTNESGEIIADNKGKGHIQFSISTWRDGGRDYLVNWLKKDKTLTKEEKAEIIARMDEFYENALKYTDVYVPFGSWSEAAVKYDKDGNPLMSVIKKNGDYSMNLDFSLVCKKRRPLNRLLRTLIARNAFGTYSLRERELAEINWILQEHGFEVACALCFVDSKRYRVTGVADVFAELYNKFVRALAPEGAKIAHFNYSNNPNIENVDGGLDTMPDSELNWKRFDELASQYGPDTVEGKVARFLCDNPSQRRLVDSTDFIDSKGFEAVKESNPALLSLYNSKKGTGGPKASFGDVQYLNDILKKSRSFSAKKAYDVGGVRIQSFSDFVAHMYFDYMQLFAELAAKKLPAHAYTKEVLFAKIFGLTGLKINMSLVPAVVEGGIAPGLDADGNYAWADAVKDAEGNVIQQAQSFPYDEAMKIQHAEGYSKNCGVIAVGISDEHIEKMLDDPNIPFIIPYHKSSLNAIVARMTNIDQYKDYTNVQNTRKADGTKLDDGEKDFNFNAWLRQHPDATPKDAAQAYLDWCRANNYKPKFSQFAYHPNYYKLLVDFNTYDARTGEYTPQGPVSMTFPTEQNDFGDVETLIQQGLQEDAELEEKMDSEIEQVADEVEKRLEEIKNEPELSKKEYAEKMAQIADERKAKLESRAATKTFDADDARIRYRSTDAQNAAVEFLAGDAKHRVIENAVNKEAEKLGVKVTYKTREEMPKGHHNDKGYFNPKTGEIVICTENASSVADAIQTILHEAVAHKGLRQLMGDRFREFINRVYNSLDAKTKAKVDALAESQYDGDIAVAMEEYMASLAETTDFSENSVWDKIKSIFNDIINAILGRNDIKIGDNELRYLLRASYNNLIDPRGMETLRGWANDMMMRESLGVGQYVTPEMDAEYLAAVERGDMETAQRMVNEAAKMAMPNTKVVDENGNPKVVYHGRGSEFNVFKHQAQYMVRNSSQIKSAEPVTYDDAGNVIPLSERFNPENEDIRYRSGIDPETVQSEGVAAAYNKAVAENWQEFQRQFQDAFQPVRNAIEAIQQATGDIPIEDYENYLLMQNQAQSRSQAEIDKFERLYYTPIFNQVKEVIKAVMEARGYGMMSRISRAKRAEIYREVVQYLIAKHGLERNKYYQDSKFRKLTPNELRPHLKAALEEYNIAVEDINNDGSLTDAERELKLIKAKDKYDKDVAFWKDHEVRDIRDYSGLTSLFGLDEDDFREAERMAKELVDDFEKLLGREDDEQTGDVVTESPVLKSLWDKINAATGYTLKHSYESGLLSKQQYEDIKSMFKFYIPLRGFDDTTAEDVYEYARFEGNRFNAAVHTAEGRTSVAADPLATIMNMAESEIAQGNKNRAKIALYNYLLNRTSTSGEQNELMQIEDVWYYKTTINGRDVYTLAVPDRENGETYSDFEERMQDLADSGDAVKSKKGKLDVGMKFQKERHKKSHYVYLKVGGVEKAIFINGDPKAADAINGTYRPDMSDAMKTIKSIQRVLSSMHTNYSLRFTIRNLIRDAYYSRISLGIKESPEYGRRFRANWWRNNAFVVMSMLKKYRSGKFDGAALNETQAAFVEFIENGGPTGYTVINSVENHKKDLERAIKRMQKGVKHGGVKSGAIFKYTLGIVEFLNECSEMATRFAAYKTSKDMGRGVIQSVNDAKEVTVNFNTKGAQDGNGWMGILAQYLSLFKYFFNASVQGSQNIIANAKNHPIKYCSTVCGLMGLGMMMPLFQSMFLELLGGDDDEYWNIPEYERQNNLCIVLGKTGKYVKLPLPIGFREMYAIGDIIAASVLNKSFDENPLTFGLNISNKIAAAALPLNPLEGTVNGLSLIESAVEVFEVDALQFRTQNKTNRDWKNTPIQKEYTYNEHDPEWTKAFASNPSWLTGLSKWCYEHIEYDGKPLNFSPEKLDNTLSNIFGGAYSAVKGVARSIETGLNEGLLKGVSKLSGGIVVGSGTDDKNRFINSSYWEMDEYYNDRIKRIKYTAADFGLTLDDVFKRLSDGETPAKAYQPRMSKIYNSDYFDFMQEWYLGHKGDEDENGDEILGLDQIRNKMKTVNNKINKAEDAESVEELKNELLELNVLYDKTRAELVNDLLEMD